MPKARINTGYKATTIKRGITGRIHNFSRKEFGDLTSDHVERERFQSTVIIINDENRRIERRVGQNNWYFA